MSATCSRAMMLKERGQKEAIALADTFCREAQLRIDDLFRNFYGANDDNMYKLAMSVLRGEHEWLEQGIARGDTEMGDPGEHVPSRDNSREDVTRATGREELAAIS